MTVAYIGIGSNMGDRQRNVDLAIGYLKENSNIKVDKISSIRETEPVGGPPQGKFLNGVMEIQTDLSPQDLLAALKKIEKILGREKIVKDGPRPIDLDILLYGDRVVDEEDLKIPHPRMRERAFVLEPLREVAPEIVQEISKKPLTKSDTSDYTDFKKITQIFLMRI